MLDAGHIVALQEEATRRWHEAASAGAQDGADPLDGADLDALVVAQHRANFDLWHEEDKARDPRAAGEEMVRIKRSIDRLNQRRNDLMERIDSLLLAACEQPAQAPLHSETPGMMIDRLSILELKRYHTREEIERMGVDERHAERNRERLAVLTEQRDDLRDALGALWADVAAGRRRFKMYRQMKMYNDPALNPVLYRAGAGQESENR